MGDQQNNIWNVCSTHKCVFRCDKGSFEQIQDCGTNAHGVKCVCDNSIYNQWHDLCVQSKVSFHHSSLCQCPNNNPNCDFPPAEIKCPNLYCTLTCPQGTSWEIDPNENQCANAQNLAIACSCPRILAVSCPQGAKITLPCTFIGDESINDRCDRKYFDDLLESAQAVYDQLQLTEEEHKKLCNKRCCQAYCAKQGGKQVWILIGSSPCLNAYGKWCQCPPDAKYTYQGKEITIGAACEKLGSTSDPLPCTTKTTTTTTARPTPPPSCPPLEHCAWKCVVDQNGNYHWINVDAILFEPIPSSRQPCFNNRICDITPRADQACDKNNLNKIITSCCIDPPTATTTTPDPQISNECSCLITCDRKTRIYQTEYLAGIRGCVRLGRKLTEHPPVKLKCDLDPKEPEIGRWRYAKPEELTNAEKEQYSSACPPDSHPKELNQICHQINEVMYSHCIAYSINNCPGSCRHKTNEKIVEGLLCQPEELNNATRVIYEGTCPQGEQNCGTCTWKVYTRSSRSIQHVDSQYPVLAIPCKQPECYCPMPSTLLPNQSISSGITNTVVEITVPCTQKIVQPQALAWCGPPTCGSCLFGCIVDTYNNYVTVVNITKNLSALESKVNIPPHIKNILSSYYATERVCPYTECKCPEDIDVLQSNQQLATFLANYCRQQLQILATNKQAVDYTISYISKVRPHVTPSLIGKPCTDPRKYQNCVVITSTPCLIDQKKFCTGNANSYCTVTATIKKSNNPYYTNIENFSIVDKCKISFCTCLSPTAEKLTCFNPGLSLFTMENQPVMVSVIPCYNRSIEYVNPPKEECGTECFKICQSIPKDVAPSSSESNTSQSTYGWRDYFVPDKHCYMQCMCADPITPCNQQTEGKILKSFCRPTTPSPQDECGHKKCTLQCKLVREGNEYKTIYVEKGDACGKNCTCTGINTPCYTVGSYLTQYCMPNNPTGCGYCQVKLVKNQNNEVVTTGDAVCRDQVGQPIQGCTCQIPESFLSDPQYHNTFLDIPCLPQSNPPECGVCVRSCWLAPVPNMSPNERAQRAIWRIEVPCHHNTSNNATCYCVHPTDALQQVCDNFPIGYIETIECSTTVAPSTTPGPDDCSCTIHCMQSFEMLFGIKPPLGVWAYLDENNQYITHIDKQNICKTQTGQTCSDDFVCPLVYYLGLFCNPQADTQRTSKCIQVGTTESPTTIGPQPCDSAYCYYECRYDTINTYRWFRVRHCPSTCLCPYEISSEPCTLLDYEKKKIILAACQPRRQPCSGATCVIYCDPYTRKTKLVKDCPNQPPHCQCTADALIGKDCVLPGVYRAENCIYIRPQEPTCSCQAICRAESSEQWNNQTQFKWFGISCSKTPTITYIPSGEIPCCSNDQPCPQEYKCPLNITLGSTCDNVPQPNRLVKAYCTTTSTTTTSQPTDCKCTATCLYDSAVDNYIWYGLACNASGGQPVSNRIPCCNLTTEEECANNVVCTLQITLGSVCTQEYHNQTTDAPCVIYQ